MSKHFDPKTEFTQGCLNDAGVRIFPSIDNLSKKFAVSRSSLFKKCQKEGWHSERLQFQKQLAAELSKQAIASSINKAETIDTSILRIAARGLQLVEELGHLAAKTPPQDICILLEYQSIELFVPPFMARQRTINM